MIYPTEHLTYGPTDAPSVLGLRAGRFGAEATSICYHAGRTLVDTGPASRWRAVRAFALQAAARRGIDRIVLTHHRADHAGNAARLRALLDVPVFAPAAAVERLRQGVRPPWHRRLAWGRVRPVEAEPLPRALRLGADHDGDSLTLHAVAAPGATDDMTCLLVPETGWLFAGDLFLARRPTTLPRDASLPALMRSLRWVLQHPVEVVFCGHAGVVPDGRRALRDKLRYLEALRGVVERRYRRDHRPLASITREMLGRETWAAWLAGGAPAKRHLIAACLDDDALPASDGALADSRLHRDTDRHWDTARPVRSRPTPATA